MRAGANPHTVSIGSTACPLAHAFQTKAKGGYYQRAGCIDARCPRASATIRATATAPTSNGQRAQAPAYYPSPPPSPRGGRRALLLPTCGAPGWDIRRWWSKKARAESRASAVLTLQANWVALSCTSSPSNFAAAMATNPHKRRKANPSPPRTHIEDEWHRIKGSFGRTPALC